MIIAGTPTKKLVNYKSDFELVLSFTDRRGIPMPPPDCDWTAKIWTVNEKNYCECSYTDGEFTDAYVNGDNIVLVVNNPGFELGTVQGEISIFHPHPNSSDKILLEVEPFTTKVELHAGASNYGDKISLSIGLDALKGDAFTYDDFTDEQIQILQTPALDAAKIANEATAKAIEATTTTVSSRKQIVDDFDAAKNSVASALIAQDIEVAPDDTFEILVSKLADVYESAELSRKIAEDTRNKNEETRVDSESQRVLTEQTRAAEEDKRQAAEASRVEAESAREEDFESVMAELLPARNRQLIDLWNSACGKHGRYNEDSGFFELNGLTDITYSQAMEILLSFSRNWNQSGLFRNGKARTNIPVEGSNFATFATNAKSLEVAVIDYVMQGTLDRAFYGCSKMHSCSIFMDYPSTVNGMFLGCVALVNLNLRGLTHGLDLRDSPLISRESFEYIITHRYGTNAFTIIVHPAVYEKLTDPENAEWFALLALASSKNITFATI